MLEHNNRVSFGKIRNLNTLFGRIITYKKLIMGQLSKADQCRGFNIPYPHLPMPLHHNQAIGSLVPDHLLL